MRIMIKICLDAGHYAKYNQSPANKNYWESETMWTLTEYLKKELLEYKDCHVITTRKEQEKDLALYSRGKKAKGYDLFISNHSNAVANGVDDKVDYVVVYRGYKNDSEELGLNLAKAISNTMGVKQTPRTNTRKSEKGDWEYYGVLRGASDVGCPYYYIVENSFHTNPASTAWLLKDENLKKLAEVQAKTIADYFKLSKKVSMPTKAITPGSSKKDIKWAQERLNKALPDWMPKLKADGEYGAKTRIAVLVVWDSLGWGKHMNDDGTKIGTSTREYLAGL
ncbi:MAG TPA: N-acetylmuramoyl-L-alanine amidase, partial [Thermoclostridium sp.]|nr:N-acetylmuramoyl-L-alanine amidase [Thermoclostridium sp.]